MTINCTDECGEDPETNTTIYRWEDPSTCCHLVVNATGNVTIFGGASNTPSYLRFASIEIYSNATITVGSQSILDTTGMGYLKGPGSSLAYGAVYAA